MPTVQATSIDTLRVVPNEQPTDLKSFSFQLNGLIMQENKAPSTQGKCPSCKPCSLTTQALMSSA